VNVESRLRTGNYSTLAMANPRLAPYGQAAINTLVALGVEAPGEKQKWVTGENIAQTWHFVSSGNTELGFVALSQVIVNGAKEGSAWIVPGTLHEPIRQDALLLANSPQNKTAIEFMNFVKSDRVSEMIVSFGYKPLNETSGRVQ
jgi:molybdenum ABC transporter molybdate-binding protein